MEIPRHWRLKKQRLSLIGEIRTKGGYPEVSLTGSPYSFTRLNYPVEKIGFGGKTVYTASEEAIAVSFPARKSSEIEVSGD